jgi:low molecular weight protein-tyrosine phosphatase
MSNVVNVQHVLFVCTGNYYRSRFAELLFNYAARERGLSWRATSRGTDVFGAGRFNVGPISNVARQALEARGVPLDADLRLPLPLLEGDLAAADLIVAVCEAEHRPHLERDFPAGAARVEYWGVEDLGVTPAEDALAALERHVTALLDRLAQSRDR